MEQKFGFPSAHHDQHQHNELAVLSVFGILLVFKISSIVIAYSVSSDELAIVYCAAFNHVYPPCFSVFSW